MRLDGDAGLGGGAGLADGPGARGGRGVGCCGVFDVVLVATLTAALILSVLGAVGSPANSSPFCVETAAVLLLFHHLWSAGILVGNLLKPVAATTGSRLCLRLATHVVSLSVAVFLLITLGLGMSPANVGAGPGAPDTQTCLSAGGSQDDRIVGAFSTAWQFCNIACSVLRQLSIVGVAVARHSQRQLQAADNEHPQQDALDHDIENLEVQTVRVSEADIAEAEMDAVGLAVGGVRANRYGAAGGGGGGNRRGDDAGTVIDVQFWRAMLMSLGDPNPSFADAIAAATAAAAAHVSSSHANPATLAAPPLPPRALRRPPPYRGAQPDVSPWQKAGLSHAELDTIPTHILTPKSTDNDKDDATAATKCTRGVASASLSESNQSICSDSKSAAAASAPTGATAGAVFAQPTAGSVAGRKWEEEPCAICLEPLRLTEKGKAVVLRRLPCQHTYHGSCIVPWLMRRNECPLDRSLVIKRRPPPRKPENADSDAWHGVVVGIGGGSTAMAFGGSDGRARS